MNTWTRYFFHAGYHGWRYRGWQRQEGFISIQQVLEEAFGRIFKTPVTVYGCGRTDAKVSASQYFFHADLPSELDFDLLFRVNKVLPDDIAIFEIIPVDVNRHARYDVTQRTYDYFIHTYKDPFLSTTSSLYLENNFDLEKMKAAVALFPKHTNYKAFCRSPERHNHTFSTVTAAELFTDASGKRLRISISANRFLKTMIRMLVGKVIETGKGTFTVEEFEHCLKTGEPPVNVIPAHPQGLYLSKVTYPYLDLPACNAFPGRMQDAGNDIWQVVE